MSFERRGGQRYIAATELAELLRERGGRAGQAQRNRLPGVVLGVRRDKAVAQVDLVCGPHRIVSLMPREVVDRLALRPGDAATAVVRPSAIVVERD